MELQGKRIVVTGAGQGLGRAYAEGIAREGGSVLVNDVAAANLKDVTTAIREAGGTIDLEQIVNQGPPQVEVSEQYAVFR